MGKMKLTKDKRKTGKSGMPNWLLTTIVFVVIAAVLVTCIASFVSTSGIVLKMSNAVVSENYKVSGAMMQYYYMLTYQNFASSYESYLSYFSLSGYSPSEHNQITVGSGQYDTSFLGSYDGTWFQYFMDQTVSDVQNMLIYCQEADRLGITLTDEEKDNIEATIDASILQVKLQNIQNGGNGEMSESTCLAAMYGNGISRKDIRKAMEISALASKCSDHIYNEIKDAVTAERIEEEYNKNVNDYNGVDYFYYRFSVNYDEITADYDKSELETKKDEILAKYRDKIAEVEKLADQAAKITDLKALQTFVLNYSANNKYDDLFDDIDVKSELLPKEEELKAIKEKMVAAVVSDTMEGKASSEDDVKEVKGESATTYTIYDISVSAEFAKAIKTLKSDLFTTVSNTKKSYTIEKADYEKDDEFIEWAFSADRKEGDIKQIVEGDAPKDGNIEVSKKYYYNSVYFLTGASKRDESNSRDIAYMLFSSEETAKNAIEKLKGIEGLTKEKFEDVADEYSAANHAVWEDYLKGEMGITAFDNWLYAEDTKIGSISDVLSMSDDSKMVAFYIEDGEVAWKVEVQDAIISEEYEAREDSIKKAHIGGVSYSTWTIDLISKR